MGPYVVRAGKKDVEDPFYEAGIGANAAVCSRALIWSMEFQLKADGRSFMTQGSNVLTEHKPPW